jgi:hypothetical protein
VHLVCHVVRDIYRELPGAFGEKPMVRHSDVVELVRALTKHWDEFPPSGFGNRENLDADLPVSAPVHRSLLRVVEKSRQLTNQPNVGARLAIALFRALDRRKDDFIHPWIIKSFSEEYDFFIGRAHLVRSEEKVPTDEGLTEHFEGFERAFHSLVGPYFSGKEELDDILRGTNSSTS